MCTHHGGSAPAVKAKARQRIEDAANRMAKELLGTATGAESEAVRLAAIKDALDRAGLVAPKTVDVAIAPNRGRRSSTTSSGAQGLSRGGGAVYRTTMR